MFSNGSLHIGRPTRTNLQHIFMDTGCSLEDLPEAMHDREICASSVTWYAQTKSFLKIKSMRPYQVLINKGTSGRVDFIVPADQSVRQIAGQIT